MSTERYIVSADDMDDGGFLYSVWLATNDVVEADRAVAWFDSKEDAVEYVAWRNAPTAPVPPNAGQPVYLAGVPPKPAVWQPFTVEAAWPDGQLAILYYQEPVNGRFMQAIGLVDGVRKGVQFHGLQPKAMALDVGASSMAPTMCTCPRCGNNHGTGI